MVNYKNGKIYVIRSYQTDKVYVGSTTQPLSRRLQKHKSCYKMYKNGIYNFVTSFKMLDYDDHYIELVEKCPCECREELRKIEGKYIIEMKNCVNKCVAGRTRKESAKAYRDNNKEKIKKILAAFYIKHKDRYKKHRAEYNAKNKKTIKIRNANWRAKNIEKCKITQAKYRVNNKEKIRKGAAKYRANNKEKERERVAKYYANNKEKESARKKKFYIDNKEKIKARRSIPTPCPYCGEVMRKALYGVRGPRAVTMMID